MKKGNMLTRGNASLASESETTLRRIGSESDAKYSSNYVIPQAWAEYIEGLSDWSVYGHFTFRDTPHPERCLKTWDLYVHKINRSMYGQRYYKHPLDKGISWARGTELQKRGIVHFHALLGHMACDPDMVFLKQTWFDLGGTYKIERYAKDKGAEFYMSKSCYAWKQGEVDLGGVLNGHSQPLPFVAKL
jgi:hypothetical protein